MLYTMIELPSDEPVQFVGVYVTQWGRVVEPTVAFREATEEEITAAALKVLKIACGVAEESYKEVKNV